MKTEAIALRVGLSLILAIVIGYERERNQSNAGIKTHAIVGVAATIIALIQAQIVQDSINLGLQHPDILGVVRSDPARLIAQVVSGIGFLGAGTIVVTKRNISGLTTAASIWSTAALGIALGMGYFRIAGFGFLAVVIIMHGLKHVISLATPQKIIVKHMDDTESLGYIVNAFDLMNTKFKILSYDIEIFHEQRVIIHIFEVDAHDETFFTDLVQHLSLNASIVSVQSSNI